MPDDGVRNYYGGPDNPYEVIKVIEAWGCNFHVGTILTYLGRLDKKEPENAIQDLIKARWYLEREIKNREKAREHLKGSIDGSKSLGDTTGGSS